LGGVEIPHPMGLEGHSDADALAHAIGDALLGAAGLGDLGTHFPDTDPRFKDANSLNLLAAIGAMLAERGWGVGQVDATVLAEAPRLAPYVTRMRERLAEALGCPPESVNVKAATGEGLGFVGRAEGIAALAVAVIIPRTRGRAG